jgi:hypothetical protein
MGESGYVKAWANRSPFISIVAQAWRPPPSNSRSSWSRSASCTRCCSGCGACTPIAATSCGPRRGAASSRTDRRDEHALTEILAELAPALSGESREAIAEHFETSGAVARVSRRLGRSPRPPPRRARRPARRHVQPARRGTAAPGPERPRPRCPPRGRPQPRPPAPPPRRRAVALHARAGARAPRRCGQRPDRDRHRRPARHPQPARRRRARRPRQCGRAARPARQSARQPLAARTARRRPSISSCWTARRPFGSRASTTRPDSIRHELPTGADDVCDALEELLMG